MNSMRVERTSERHPSSVGWFMLLLLLLLRIPYTIFIIYYLPIENQNGSAFYEVSTYLLTCFLIWWERERLDDFHIDTLALSLIIFLRPVQTLVLSHWHVDSPLALPRPLGVTVWGISLVLLVALWRSGYKPEHVTTRSFLWILAGIALGIALSITENIATVKSMLSQATTHSTLGPVVASSTLNLLYHLSFAPVNEEPLFRGFLWGYLRKMRWKEFSIWILQAILFASAHVYLATQFPLRFWIFIPISGLLLGLLAWRSRSVAGSIITHGLVNGSVYLLIVVLMLITLQGIR